MTTVLLVSERGLRFRMVSAETKELRVPRQVMAKASIRSTVGEAVVTPVSIYHRVSFQGGHTIYEEVQR